VSSDDEQRREWEAFVASQHAKGLCEFSGLRVTRCVASVCDCFETPERAAEIERLADNPDTAERLRLVEAGEVCHCGSPVDVSEWCNRGMCTHCDYARCDAYPGECGRDDAPAS
jgi:hypothetical protein